MFMHYELTVNLCSEERRVFLQDGFYAPSDTTASLHNHNYAEIHVISGGNAVIAAGEHSFHLESGDAMIYEKVFIIGLRKKTALPCVLHFK